MISSEQKILEINPNIKTAIIYSVAELNTFLVELHFAGQSHYISNKNEPNQFNSLELAKNAARANHATQGYQALENLYQDVGLSSLDGDSVKNSFEYLPIDLS